MHKYFNDTFYLIPKQGILILQNLRIYYIKNRKLWSQSISDEYIHYEPENLSALLENSDESENEYVINDE